MLISLLHQVVIEKYTPLPLRTMITIATSANNQDSVEIVCSILNVV